MSKIKNQRLLIEGAKSPNFSKDSYLSKCRDYKAIKTPSRSNASTSLLNILNCIQSANSTSKVIRRKISQLDQNAQLHKKVRKNLSLTELSTNHQSRPNLQNRFYINEDQLLVQEAYNVKEYELNKSRLHGFLKKIPHNNQITICSMESFLKISEGILFSYLAPQAEHGKGRDGEKNLIVTFFNEIKSNLQAKSELSKHLEESSHAFHNLKSTLNGLEAENSQLKIETNNLKSELRDLEKKFEMENKMWLKGRLDRYNSMPTEVIELNTKKTIKTQELTENISSIQEMTNLLKDQFASIQTLLRREKHMRTFFSQISDTNINSILDRYLEEIEKKEKTEVIQNYKQKKKIINHEEFKIKGLIPGSLELLKKQNPQNSSMADDSIVNDSDESSFNFAWRQELSQSADHFGVGTGLQQAKPLQCKRLEYQDLL